jgi:hypothetical protein
MMIASTPSLNASSRPVGMRQILGPTDAAPAGVDLRGSAGAQSRTALAATAQDV